MPLKKPSKSLFLLALKLRRAITKMFTMQKCLAGENCIICLAARGCETTSLAGATNTQSSYLEFLQ